MSSAPANLLPTLRRAAELRAGGASWDAVAEQTGRKATTLRRWPAAYPEDWRAAFAAAQRENLEETGAESLLVLRQLLRSKDEKIRRDVGRALAAALLAAPPDDAAPADDDAAHLADHLRSLDDAATDELIAELLAARQAARGAAPAAQPGALPK